MRAAQRLAMAGDLVRTDCIEVTEFPELARKYQVRGVPKTLFNEREELLGAAPDEQFLEHLLAAGGRKP